MRIALFVTLLVILLLINNNEVDGGFLELK